MLVIVNGAARDVASGSSVEDLIRHLDLNPRFVVVEHNGEALERKRYGEVSLADGDRIELVRAVAGGSIDRPASLAGARLYVVTDARERRGDLSEFLEKILGAGVDIVQLREKDAEAGEILRWGEVFKEAAARHNALFIINDRADVALALEADGVHLGQNDLSPRVAREILGPDAIVGLSCHSAEDHSEAPLEADYLTAGPIHATPTKPGRPGTGLALVASAARNVSRPWFAIGGIDPSNVGEVVAMGAARIVVVRAVTEADDPAAAAGLLRAALP